jgi:hypothetical protein
MCHVGVQDLERMRVMGELMANMIASMKELEDMQGDARRTRDAMFEQRVEELKIREQKVAEAERLVEVRDVGVQPEQKEVGEVVQPELGKETEKV